MSLLTSFVLLFTSASLFLLTFALALQFSSAIALRTHFQHENRPSYFALQFSRYILHLCVKWYVPPSGARGIVYCVPRFPSALSYVSDESHRSKKPTEPRVAMRCVLRSPFYRSVLTWSGCCGPIPLPPVLIVRVYKSFQHRPASFGKRSCVSYNSHELAFLHHLISPQFF